MNMKHIIAITIISIGLFAGYCASAQHKTTKELRQKAIPMATTGQQEGVCVGSDTEGLVCL